MQIVEVNIGWQVEIIYYSVTAFKNIWKYKSKILPSSVFALSFIAHTTFSNFHFYFIAFMIVFFSGQQLVILTSNCSPRAHKISTSSIALPFTSSSIERILESIMHQTPSSSFSKDKLHVAHLDWQQQCFVLGWIHPFLISQATVLNCCQPFDLRSLWSSLVPRLSVQPGYEAIFEDTSQDFKDLHGSTYAITRKM